MTRFVDVHNMVRWAAGRGPETIISGMIEYVENDFRRWESFDKTPRIASHSVRKTLSRLLIYSCSCILACWQVIFDDRPTRDN